MSKEKNHNFKECNAHLSCEASSVPLDFFKIDPQSSC